MNQPDYIGLTKPQLEVIQKLISLGIPRPLHKDATQVLKELECVMDYWKPKDMKLDQVFSTEEVDKLCNDWGQALPNNLALRRAIFRSIEKATLGEVKKKGEVTVTTTQDGEVVAVTRTDEDHKILSIIWEKPDNVTSPVDNQAKLAPLEAQESDGRVDAPRVRLNTAKPCPYCGAAAHYMCGHIPATQPNRAVPSGEWLREIKQAIVGYGSAQTAYAKGTMGAMEVADRYTKVLILLNQLVQSNPLIGNVDDSEIEHLARAYKCNTAGDIKGFSHALIRFLRGGI